MAIELSKLVSFLDSYLNAKAYQDYCPNGLQVEGRSTVKKIVTGVTASQALIDYAVSVNADAVLVHHGYFWKGEDQAITGLKRKRIQTLLKNDISLIAYHLPLDAHPEIGNNAQLAKLLNLQITGPLDSGAKQSIGIMTQLEQAMTAEKFADQITIALGRECGHIGDGSKLVQKVGLCTGAAQSMINLAVTAGADAFISGEISEPTFHIAYETGVHYFSAGHHATERGGVSALGQVIEKEFSIEVEFKDLYNPI